MSLPHSTSILKSSIHVLTQFNVQHTPFALPIYTSPSTSHPTSICVARATFRDATAKLGRQISKFSSDLCRPSWRIAQNGTHNVTKKNASGNSLTVQTSTHAHRLNLQFVWIIFHKLLCVAGIISQSQCKLISPC